MIGGVITLEILELTIYPAIYLIWKRGLEHVSTPEACPSSLFVEPPVDSAAHPCNSKSARPGRCIFMEPGPLDRYFIHADT